MQGRIIKGIAGVYYVYVDGIGLLECRARGVFRKDGVKPLVGDNAEVDVLNREEKTGNIVRLLARENELIRPAVANVDQALVIFAVAKPQPNFNLLDRFLIMMEQQSVPAVICFNKTDIAGEEELCKLRDAYRGCGYPMLFTSADQSVGIEQLQEVLAGKTTVVAGPSGVGKSSLINLLQQNVEMETGRISEKIARGRHTTRHAQLIPIDGNTFICDTPGFSSLHVFDCEKEELKDLFPEFMPYAQSCRFTSCLHREEPQCGVKQALQEGKISAIRYEDYRQILEELESRTKY